MALKVTQASTLTLDLNIDSILDIDDHLLLIIKLSDAQHHASIMSYFLLNNSLHFDVLDILDFSKILTKFDKIGATNLNKQPQKSLDFSFKPS